MSFNNLLKSFKGPQLTCSREKEREKNPLSTKLKDIWQSNSTGRSTAALSEGVPGSTSPFLGILIIIVDSLPHEALWRLWVEKYEHEKIIEYSQKTHKESEIKTKNEKENEKKTEKKSAEINEKIQNEINFLGGGDVILTDTDEKCASDAVNDDKCDSGIVSESDVDATSTGYSAPIRFLIHAKHPERIKSAWVKERLVNFHLKPGWGSLELTEVMVKMLQEAVEYPDITHFCFASESCVPILSVQESLSAVRADPNSWVDYQVKANNGYATQYQFDILKDHLPKECIMKADQWVMLNRPHAEKVLGLPALVGGSILHLFKKVKASDEMYFVCCLAILGLIPPIGEGGSSPLPSLSSSSSKEHSLSSSASKEHFSTSSSTERSSSSSSTEPSSQLQASSVLTESTNDYNTGSMIRKRKLTSVLWGQGDKSPQTFFALLAADLERARRGGSLFFRKLKLKDSTDACRDKILTDWVLMILNDCSDSVKADSNLSTLINEDCNLAQPAIAINLINDAIVESNTQVIGKKESTSQVKFSVEYCLLRAQEYLSEPSINRAPVYQSQDRGGGSEERDRGKRASISPYRNNTGGKDSNRDDYIGHNYSTNTDSRDHDKQDTYYDQNSRYQYNGSSSGSRHENHKKRKIDENCFDDVNQYGDRSISGRNYKRYSGDNRNYNNYNNDDT
eukprot:CAMPEP_0119047336 /NCGR_PEP_ID=MMETSP1177-20130426/52643_1 /TAXON_ID=2985 /ORGANISM="Ochromonas sp, Strain CCMP1899" /LENGTH=679 /DNA_ID=CAMNT_0007021835 /DNA_START=254 /DNA_END=2289 /DNA_ORIENTATION=+